VGVTVGVFLSIAGVFIFVQYRKRKLRDLPRHMRTRPAVEI